MRSNVVLDDTESKFVWRVITSTDRTTHSDVVSDMGYTKWYPEEPNTEGNREACMMLIDSGSYRWNDGSCSSIRPIIIIIIITIIYPRYSDPEGA